MIMICADQEQNGPAHAQATRAAAGYPSDLTDAQCVLGRRGRPLLWNLRRACRRVRLIWADAVYGGKLVTWAATALHVTVEIVRKRDPHTFEPLPCRWVVERTLAWISKHRRTVRDYERLPASHEAMVLWAMIALMARLAQPCIQLSNTHCSSGTWPGMGLR
jgi:transposase